ncbi:MAG: hypothetical protein WA003_08795 [Desulfuromonadaceae bacterium]
MGYKPHGEKMTPLGRKIYLQLEKLIMSRRSESPATKKEHLNSARLFAHFLTKKGSPGNGPQNANEFGKKHVDLWKEHRKLEVGKGQLEKDAAMLRNVTDKQGRGNLMPAKNGADIKRTYSERNKPKKWTSPTDRDERQAKLEAKSERYGLAAKIAQEFGERRAESLTSRWIIVREGNIFMSNWGTKDPSVDMKVISIRQIRYMYATKEERKNEPPKDWAFEDKKTGHLYATKEGVPYLYVGKEAKNGVKHLVPIQTQSQWDAVKAVNEFCMREKTENLYPQGMNPEQAKRQFSAALREVGMTKKDAGYTLHVDRHEYVQRSSLPDTELIRAVGHGDVRKLDAYRPKK